ncbi:PucR family transcriptional regulator [Homoserinibacter sp. YIM 151385]|uniref:PucR family transcriptional regulator n=1 Tax=Homoserinibacter sp. YIM 151385 TaxID=2985506 RepID=UPI0022F0D9E0|nr:helix-turn-helix domain-containing protein [Homoserinibacter sp. YIM 151385]WBU37896.1 helix-turn-helix domain-containing protein [Homoserinibacter sp. YIM 151385]
MSSQSQLIYAPDVDLLTARTVDIIWGSYPGYSSDVFDKKELIPSVRQNLLLAVRVLRRGAAPSPEELREGRGLGARRASQSVPLESVIQAYRSAERTIILDLFSDSQSWPVRLTSHYADLVISTFDLLTQEMIDSYRDTSTSIEAARRRVENELVRAVVEGAPHPAELDTWTRTLGIDPRLPRIAFAIATDSVADFAEVHRLRRRLAAALQPHVAGPVVFGDVGELTVGLASPRRAADFPAALERAVRQQELEGRLVIGVGGAASDLRAAAESCRQAIETAGVAGGRPGGASVTHYADVLVDVLLSSRPQVADELAASRLGELDRHPHLVETLEALIAHDLSQSAAARALFVHVNTVAHRLRRIHELTGYDPLRLDDLVSMAIALRWRGRGKASTAGAAGTGHDGGGAA